MADEKKDTQEKKIEKEEKPQPQSPPQPQAGSKIGILVWIILGTVVIFTAASGFVIGHLLAHPMPQQAAQASQEEEKETEKGEKDSVAGPNDTWYYNELESIVVNPDEPGATRFVRVGLTLEINSGLDKEKAHELIEQKKPLLVNWLNLYFKSLTLNEMQNERDMKLILAQICDSFNEILFPGSRPQINKILIKEFNIQ